MINIEHIRENPELIKENIKKKFQEEKLPLVDKVKKLDEKWRKQKLQTDKLRAQRNKISEQINKAKKSNQPIEKLIKKAKEIPDKIKKNEEKNQKLKKEINEILIQIPNIIHKSVPVGKDESENKEIKKINKPSKIKNPKSHIELGESLEMLDFDTSSETSGKGFYYLKDKLALLNQALIRYAIDFMQEKGFTYIETPLMLRKDVIGRVADLNDMKNQIYKIQDEDLYLIGTSEHSLIGRFIDNLIQEKNLPIKNTSYSMCFRKEIGSHGLEEKGLFRTHQFNKIEMIVICKPEQSMDFFNLLQDINIDMFKQLEIPIRILEMCSGDLGELKHKQIDIEAYSPITNNYYEVGSCSNCTDAQARKLKIRAKGKEKYTPHTLNNTAIATSRALIAIMENHQTEKGTIKIPKALHKYTGFKEIKP